MLKSEPSVNSFISQKERETLIAFSQDFNPFLMPSNLDSVFQLTTKSRLHGRRDSNSRHLVLETSALPTELHPYYYNQRVYTPDFIAESQTV